MATEILSSGLHESPGTLTASSVVTTSQLLNTEEDMLGSMCSCDNRVLCEAAKMMRMNGVLASSASDLRTASTTTTHSSGTRMELPVSFGCVSTVR